MSDFGLVGILDVFESEVWFVDLDFDQLRTRILVRGVNEEGTNPNGLPKLQLQSALGSIRKGGTAYDYVYEQLLVCIALEKRIAGVPLLSTQQLLDVMFYVFIEAVCLPQVEKFQE